MSGSFWYSCGGQCLQQYTAPTYVACGLTTQVSAIGIQTITPKNVAITLAGLTCNASVLLSSQ
eukprot:11157829-Lingulodinium_polyedra.AAC.1